MERRIFVLVPVYKTEKYIDACIRSVLEQSCGNFRLILVDDGTPDRSGDICEEYAAKDSRICVIHKANGGLISARRAAIGAMLREANDEDFAVFLDSDDTLKPQALQVIDETVAANNCDMVVYGMDRVFEGRLIESFRPVKSFTGTIEDKGQLYRTVFLSSNYNPLCRKAVSVKLLSDDDYSMYYHISKGEDLLQSLPIYKKCRKAVFLKDSLYNYTFNPDSISNSYRYENFQIDATVRQAVMTFLKEEAAWDSRDMEAYLAYCRKLTINLIRRIASFKTEKANQIKLLQNVAEDAYYRQILNTAGKKERALSLLKASKFDELLIYLTLENKVRNAARMLRRKLKV